MRTAVGPTRFDAQPCLVGLQQERGRKDPHGRFQRGGNEKMVDLLPAAVIFQCARRVRGVRRCIPECGKQAAYASPGIVEIAHHDDPALRIFCKQGIGGRLQHRQGRCASSIRGAGTAPFGRKMDDKDMKRCPVGAGDLIQPHIQDVPRHNARHL